MSGSYNIDISAAEAKRLYFNYYCQNNSYGTSASRIGEISNAYSDKLPEWQALVEKAENGDIVDYDIDSDDVMDGKNQARDYSGYDNSTKDKVGKWAGIGANGAAAGGTAFMAYTGVGKGASKWLGQKALGGAGGKIITTGAEKAGEKAAKKAAKKGLNEAGQKSAKEAAENSAKDVSIIAACAFDLAGYITYEATDPNAKAVDASVKYGESMPEKQEECVNNDAEITSLGEDLDAATEESVDNCDEANSYMADNMTEVGLYDRQIKCFQNEETRGYEHTKDDIEAYLEALEMIQELSDENDGVTDDIESATAEKYEEMEGAQDTFDDKSEDIGNIKGYTTEAQDVADGAQLSSNVEGTILGAEGVMSGLHAAKAATKAVACGFSPLTFVYAASAAAAGVAAVGDGKGAYKEFQNAEKCGQVSDACDATKELNNQSMETLNSTYENYQVNVDTMKNLTIEKPDIEIPDEIEVETPPETTAGPNVGGTNPSANNDGEDGKDKNNKPKKI